MSRLRLILCVLLPFAAGYYLSYVFRTINALIASDLTAELNISAADLGFLTSVYFLVFAAVQLPLGALLDRYGPKTIQSSLLLLASVGALVFALADGLIGLLIGRALRESTGQTTNRAGQRLIERELNVQPTLTVRARWPLRVIVHKDLVLTPYRVE